MSLMKNLQNVALICVHDGRFHFDDVLAAALLRCAGCLAPIVRSREAQAEKTLYVDVGRRYDGEWCFDHHQDDAPLRSRYYSLGSEAPRTRFCAAGLLWRDLGPELTGTLTNNPEDAQKVFEELDERLFMWADYRDNGIELPNSMTNNCMSLAEFVNAGNGADVNDAQTQDELFKRAVEAVVPLLYGCIENAVISARAVRVSREAFAEAAERGARYAMLPPYADGRWKKAVQDDTALWKKTRDLKAAVIPNSATEDLWVYMMPKTRESAFDCRCRLSQDLKDEFKSFSFIHHNGFMGVLKDIEEIEDILAKLKIDADY